MSFKHRNLQRYLDSIKEKNDDIALIYGFSQILITIDLFTASIDNPHMALGFMTHMDLCTRILENCKDVEEICQEKQQYIDKQTDIPDRQYEHIRAQLAELDKRCNRQSTVPVVVDTVFRLMSLSSCACKTIYRSLSPK